MNFFVKVLANILIGPFHKKMCDTVIWTGKYDKNVFVTDSVVNILVSIIYNRRKMSSDKNFVVISNTAIQVLGTASTSQLGEQWE